MNWTRAQQQWFQLNRRSFSKVSLGALGAWWLSSKGLAQQQNNSPANANEWEWEHSYGELPADAGQKAHTIRYIRDSAPEFHIPPYSGEHYEDTVPDTLDIAERAKLGVRLLTSITDPLADHEIYWTADFAVNPPVMAHAFSDWVQNCEGFVEALPLLRLASGSSLNNHIDPVWMTGILRSIGPDGL